MQIPKNQLQNEMHTLARSLIILSMKMMNKIVYGNNNDNDAQRLRCYCNEPKCDNNNDWSCDFVVIIREKKLISVKSCFTANSCLKKSIDLMMIDSNYRPSSTTTTRLKSSVHIILWNKIKENYNDKLFMAHLHFSASENETKREFQEFHTFLTFDRLARNFKRKTISV